MKIQTQNRTMSGSGAYVLIGHRYTDVHALHWFEQVEVICPGVSHTQWGNGVDAIGSGLGLNTVAQAQILGQMTTHSLNATRASQTHANDWPSLGCQPKNLAEVSVGRGHGAPPWGLLVDSDSFGKT